MIASIKLPKRVRIVEVGPRDGLQNEPVALSWQDRTQFIDLLSAAGFSAIEAGAFVKPSLVPQMADTGDVLKAIQRNLGVRYPVLVPNAKGLQLAVESGAQEIAVFAAASESFSQKNINMTIEQSLANYAEVVAQAKGAGLWVRAYVSTAFDCPYEGAVPVKAVSSVANQLGKIGADEIAIGDTIGTATPARVSKLTDSLLRVIPPERLAYHFHDTRGMAAANVLTAMLHGIWIFDSSAAGLGGCPFAPGAAGNLASEDLLYMLSEMGIETGVDIEKLTEASRFVLEKLHRPAASRTLQAILSK